MNVKLVLGLIVMSLFVSSCKTTDEIEAGQDFIIKNVNVIPMTGDYVLENQSVLVRAGKIEEIGTDITAGDDVYVINGSGKYLIPGLSDMHAHIYYEHDNNLHIANGVTLARNMHGYEELLEIREQINRGDVLGPEIWTGTPLIDGVEPMWPMSVNITEKDNVEGIITDLHNQGYDFVKTYNTLTEDVYMEIVRVAEELDMKVAGHVSYIFDKNKTVGAGHYSDEHLTAYSLKWQSVDAARPTLDLAIDKGMWNVPTMITIKNNDKYQYFMENGYELLKYCPSEVKDYWTQDWYMPYWDYDRSVELIKELHEKGGKLVTGTDHGVPYVVPGFSIHEELEIFVEECGLSPYDALLTSTINAARLLEVDDRLGTIEVGKDADLVLLKKNPLKNIRNIRSIESVIVKGKLLNRYKLKNMLKAAEEDYK